MFLASSRYREKSVPTLAPTHLSAALHVKSPPMLLGGGQHGPPSAPQPCKDRGFRQCEFSI